MDSQSNSQGYQQTTSNPMGQTPMGTPANPMSQQPVPPKPSVDDSTTTMGIVSIVLGFFAALIGLIIGLVGLSNNKKVKQTTGADGKGKNLLIVGIVISSLNIVAGIIVMVMIFIGLMASKSIIEDNLELDQATDSNISSAIGSVASLTLAYLCVDDDLSVEMMETCSQPTAVEAIREACTDPYFVKEHIETCGNVFSEYNTADMANPFLGFWLGAREGGDIEFEENTFYWYKTIDDISDNYFAGTYEWKAGALRHNGYDYGEPGSEIFTIMLHYTEQMMDGEFGERNDSAQLIVQYGGDENLIYVNNLTTGSNYEFERF